MIKKKGGLISVTLRPCWGVLVWLLNVCWWCPDIHQSYGHLRSWSRTRKCSEKGKSPYAVIYTGSYRGNNDLALAWLMFEGDMTLWPPSCVVPLKLALSVKKDALCLHSVWITSFQIKFVCSLCLEQPIDLKYDVLPF